MLTKNDLLLLLSTLDNGDENINRQISKVLSSDNVSYDVLKFINDKRQFDVSVFYELLRKNYNHKKSNLYINIVRDDIEDPNELLITLAALNLQILLFAKKLPDNKMFLKHSRAEEITQVLNNYYKTYDLIPCFKVIKIIKADLKAFEAIK